LLHKFKDKTYNYISKKIKHASHTILNTYDPFLFELNADFMQAKKNTNQTKLTSSNDQIYWNSTEYASTGMLPSSATNIKPKDASTGRM